MITIACIYKLFCFSIRNIRAHSLLISVASFVTSMFHLLFKFEMENWNLIDSRFSDHQLPHLSLPHCHVHTLSLSLSISGRQTDELMINYRTSSSSSHSHVHSLAHSWFCIFQLANKRIGMHPSNQSATFNHSYLSLLVHRTVTYTPSTLAVCSGPARCMRTWTDLIFFLEFHQASSA